MFVYFPDIAINMVCHVVTKPKAATNEGLWCTCEIPSPQTKFPHSVHSTYNTSYYNGGKFGKLLLVKKHLWS